MRTLLITGPIGSGKSLVSEIFRKQGIAVYDCDKQAKMIYQRHPDLIVQIEQYSKCSLRDEEGTLLRSRLAALIFSDTRTRLFVNSLVHPRVVADFQDWAQQQKGDWVAMESALFLSSEAGANPHFDYVLYVDAPYDLRLERIQARDLCGEQAARARMATQDFSVHDSRITKRVQNDTSPFELEQNIIKIIQSLTI